MTVEEGFMVEETVEEARLLLRLWRLWTVVAVVGEVDAVLLEGEEGVVVDVVGVDESCLVTRRGASGAEEATMPMDGSIVVSVVVVVIASSGASD